MSEGRGTASTNCRLPVLPMKRSKRSTSRFFPQVRTRAIDVIQARILSDARRRRDSSPDPFLLLAVGAIVMMRGSLILLFTFTPICTPAPPGATQACSPLAGVCSWFWSAPTGCRNDDRTKPSLPCRVPCGGLDDHRPKGWPWNWPLPSTAVHICRPSDVCQCQR